MSFFVPIKQLQIEWGVIWVTWGIFLHTPGQRDDKRPPSPTPPRQKGWTSVTWISLSPVCHGRGPGRPSGVEVYRRPLGLLSCEGVETKLEASTHRPLIVVLVGRILFAEPQSFVQDVWPVHWRHYGPMTETRFDTPFGEWRGMVPEEPVLSLLLSSTRGCFTGLKEFVYCHIFYVGVVTKIWVVSFSFVRYLCVSSNHRRSPTPSSLTPHWQTTHTPERLHDFYETLIYFYYQCFITLTWFTMT